MNFPLEPLFTRDFPGCLMTKGRTFIIDFLSIIQCSIPIAKEFRIAILQLNVHLTSIRVRELYI